MKLVYHENYSDEDLEIFPPDLAELRKQPGSDLISKSKKIYSVGINIKIYINRSNLSIVAGRIRQANSLDNWTRLLGHIVFMFYLLF